MFYSQLSSFTRKLWNEVLGKVLAQTSIDQSVYFGARRTTVVVLKPWQRVAVRVMDTFQRVIFLKLNLG